MATVSRGLTAPKNELGNRTYYCRVCGKTYKQTTMPNYCKGCGQNLEDEGWGVSGDKITEVTIAGHPKGLIIEPDKRIR